MLIEIKNRSDSSWNQNYFIKPDEDRNQTYSLSIILVLMMMDSRLIFRVWIHRNCVNKDTIIKIKIIFGMLEVD